MTQEIVCIYARAANGTIGKGGQLPWHIPADLKRFKQLTTDTPMIMGRKTFESLPGMLPGRRHIVITRRERWESSKEQGDAEIAHTDDEALALAGEGTVSVIGGAAIYDLFIPRASRIELTEIHADYAGDTKMPPLGEEWVEIERVDHPAADGLPAFSFVTLIRERRQHKREDV